VSEADIIEHTKRWINAVVIGFNLCLFASRVFQNDQIRYVVTDTQDQEELLQVLSAELAILAHRNDSSIETTIIIHPHVLNDFLDYVDFLTLADKQLKRLGHQGTVQLASFHPQYQFDDADIDSVENYTNRSPYPMLHLLREESISKVATDPRQMAEIPRRNKRMMTEMGRDKMEELLRTARTETP